MKKQLEAKLAQLKKHRQETVSYISDLQSQHEHALKIKFSGRASSINELMEQESYYLAIINVKINNVTNQLKKFQ